VRWLASLLWNRDERRPRAFWRLLLQALMLGAAWLGLAIVAGLLPVSPDVEWLLGIGACLLMIATVWLASRLLDRRPLADFGLRIDRAWASDCCFGLALGLLMMVGVFAAAALAGWVTVRAVAVSSAATGLYQGFLEFVLVAVSEELLSRGYQLRNVAEGLRGRHIGPRAALATGVIISAAIFAVLHLPDRETSALSVVNTFLAGVLLGVAFVYTGRLGLPVGIHVTWNFAQGPVFGFPISGNCPRAALLTIADHGPAEWTGGAYGPEAGLLATIAFLVALALTLVWIRARYGPLSLKTTLTEYRRT
jgi:membrane protease YdiL (CAAX protease family)